MSKKQKPKPNRRNETDSGYLFKLLLYLILGSLWVKITRSGNVTFPIPVGAVIGLVFSSHEHFKIDRRVEYAVLLLAMLIGYGLPFGLYIGT